MRPSVVLSALLFSTTALSSPPSKATFQGLYDKLSRSYEQKDLKTLDSFFTADFKQVTPGQAPVTHAQLLRALASEMKLLKNVKWVRSVKDVKVVKGGYEVVVTGHITGTMMLKDGKLHKMAMDGAAVDEWTKSMKIQLAKVTSLSMTIDGKKTS